MENTTRKDPICARLNNKKHTYREGNAMIVLTFKPRKKRIRDFFVKPEPQRHFFNYEFPKEAKTTNEPTNRDA